MPTIKAKSKNNPYKANQYVADPRQAKFIEYYTKTGSKTFANTYQSALKAGFSESYATNLTAQMPTWLFEKLEKLKDESLIRKAEQNISGFLHNDEQPRIQADMTKFVSERLNRSKYGAKQEITHSFDTGVLFQLEEPTIIEGELTDVKKIEGNKSEE